MPVTKTAKRALRASKRKATVNSAVISRLEIAVRLAKKGKKVTDVRTAVSLADRAAKNGLFHKNRAARLKRSLLKLL